MAYHKNDSLLVLELKDKRNVLKLSTWHNNQTEPVRRVPKKNEEEIIQNFNVICDYNKNMGGMDVADQYMSSHSFIKK